MPGSTLLARSDSDTFFEYGYVWLPYGVAALGLFALGAVAAVRWRRARPGVAELLITSGALLGVLAMVILSLADGAIEGNGLAAIDPIIWQWAVDHRTPALTVVATTVTEVGSTVSMAVIATVTTLFLWVTGRRGDAVLVAVVAAGAGLLVRVGKATVGRQRPPEEYRLVVETNESFPSGHALASAAIIGVVLVVLVPLIPSTPWRVTAVAAGVLFVLAIGWSRIYLGVHWFTDVMAGWLTGLAWLMLCLTVREVWRMAVDAVPPPFDRPARPALADPDSGDRPPS
ncbi:MAG TPA: phosphatase PAP2 family protein [Nakamurella sp.]